MQLVAAALEAETPGEYAEIIDKIPKDMVSSVAIDTTEKDSKIQYAITKLIVGLSVFLSANFKRDAPYSFSHLQPGACKDNYIEGMGTRRFFFRNLKSGKYYRNQYAKLKAGSRWVFVRQAKIGQYHAEHID